MSEVLALKYRPTTFEEVIGQDLIIKQLQSALEKDTLGHTLLFCGTRGTGKTTTARIVARELNLDIEDWKHKHHLVLTEVDGASNNGVDDVRELIEAVRYSVQGHKVIIIDEVHMLSKSAFNALLKTLEEPPEGVTFILCTTEPHKLPDTVKSRCQIYEFQEVDKDILVSYYTELMGKEGIDADAEAVALKAQGSVRDGLSILQKSLSGETLENHSQKYFELVGAIYGQDVTTALYITSELRKVEEARVIIQTLERWVWWCSLENFGMKTPIRDFFEESNLKFDLQHLQRLFDCCLEIERSFTATPNAKIVLEMGIMKLNYV